MLCHLQSSLFGLISNPMQVVQKSKFMSASLLRSNLQFKTSTKERLWCQSWDSCLSTSLCNRLTTDTAFNIKWENISVKQGSKQWSGFQDYTSSSLVDLQSKGNSGSSFISRQFSLLIYFPPLLDSTLLLTSTQTFPAFISFTFYPIVLRDGEQI